MQVKRVFFEIKNSRPMMISLGIVFAGILFSFIILKGYPLSKMAVAVMSVLCLIGMLAIYSFMFVRQWSLERVFPIVGLIFGLVMMILIPVGCVPDEPLHFWNVYQLSDKIMRTPQEDANIPMRYDDTVFLERIFYSEQEEYESYYAKVQQPLENGEIVKSIFFQRGDDLYLYIAPALGISFARLLHIGAGMTFQIGRLFSLLFYLGAVTLAIRKAPIGKMVFFVIGLLPMTLQQAASHSYDYFVISCSIVIFSYTLFFLYRKEEDCSIADGIIYGITCMLLFPVKQHTYFLVALFPVVVLLAKWRSPSKMKKYMLVIIAVLVLFYYAPKIPDFIQSIGGDQPVPEGGGGGNGHWSLSTLLHDPFLLIALLWNTSVMQFGYYIPEIIGTILGWLDMHASALFVYAWMMVIFFASIRRKDEELPLKGVLRAWFFLVAIITSGFFIIGMAYSWTPVGVMEIQGIQGRYFLPIVSIFLVCSKTTELEFDAKWDKYIVMTHAVIYTMFVLAIATRLVRW